MISRRSMLFGAAGLAAGAVVMDGTAALADGPGPAGSLGLPDGAQARPDHREAEPTRPGAPATLVNRRAGLAGRAVLAPAAFPLTELGVAWTGAVPPGVRVRTAAGWSDWSVVGACTGRGDCMRAGWGDGAQADRGDGARVGRRGAGARAGLGDRAPAGRGTSIRAGRDGGSAVLSATGVTAYELHALHGQSVDVLELNTRDGHREPVVVPIGRPAEAGLAGLRSWWAQRRQRGKYLSRVDWGANDAIRRRNPDGSDKAEYTSIQTITVHHSGFTAGRNPGATVRGIYTTDVLVDGYDDIGYHLLIDDAGRIYEGRWSGTDGLPVFGPWRDAAGNLQMVNGAHVGGFNAANIGICLLGNFTATPPTLAMRLALRDVLALLCGQCKLDPTGTTWYVNPLKPATTATVRTIAGHRDWARTQCPGGATYQRLESIRAEVRASLGR